MSRERNVGGRKVAMRRYLKEPEPASGYLSVVWRGHSQAKYRWGLWGRMTLRHEITGFLPRRPLRPHLHSIDQRPHSTGSEFYPTCSSAISVGLSPSTFSTRFDDFIRLYNPSRRSVLRRRTVDRPTAHYCIRSAPSPGPRLNIAIYYTGTGHPVA